MRYLQEVVMADELLERVKKLERQNKRMSVAIAALCLCMGALLTMAQTLPRKTDYSMERIEAQEIVLNDGVTQAKLTANALVFSGTSGRYVIEIKPTGLVCSRDGVPRLDLSVGEIGAALAFKTSSGLTGAMLDESTMVLMNNVGILSLRPEHLFLQKGEADTFLTSSSLRIRDAEKFKAILGEADLRISQAGDPHTRSAASLILLGKDNKVLWQAP